MNDAQPITNAEYVGCEVALCGWTSKRRRVKCFEFLNNRVAMLILLSLGVTLQSGVIYGAFGSVLNTLEKRFEYRSVESAIIVTCFGIGFATGMIFISIYAERGSKPRWVGAGLIVQAIGCFIFIIPHLSAPSYRPHVEGNMTDLCSEVELTTKCDHSPLRYYWIVFMFAILLVGFGMSPIMSYGIAYLDENATKAKSALYSGIFFAASAFGPGAISFATGGFLGLYTYVGKEGNISSSDSGWIGAWWLIFLLIGACELIIGILIMMLPRKLKQSDGNETEEASENETLSFLETMRSIFTNKKYVAITISRWLNQSYLYGLGAFAVKYIKIMFYVSESEAAWQYGAVALIAGVVGLFLGGLIITTFKLEDRGIILLLLAGSAIAVPLSASMLIHCPDNKWSLITATKVENPMFLSNVSCHTTCHCSSDVFEPVCGDDGVSYYSPCHAGCQTQINETHYTDCDCLSDGFTNARKNECPPAEQCTTLIPFIVLMFFLFLVSLSLLVPSVQLTLRTVDFRTRSSAIALQQAFASGIGVTPARIIVGKVFDGMCVVWSTDCGSLGACRVYNHQQLVIDVLISTFVIKGLHFVSICFAAFFEFHETSNKTTKSVKNHSNNKGIKLPTVVTNDYFVNTN